MKATLAMVICLWCAEPLFATTHYVSSEGAHIYPFASWEDAATNIQSAVDACADGHMVYVTNGTYILTNETAVDANILLASINGPDVTIIDGNHATRCLNLGSNECAVSGFTIRNGNTFPYGGGLYTDNRDSFVTNCNIIGNMAGGGGGGLYGGTAYNCLFQGNYGGEWGGGGMMCGTAYACDFIHNEGNTYGGALYEGAAFGCTIISNFSEYGAGIGYGNAMDCTFMGNRTSDEGGGMYEGAASNCTFNGNLAQYGGGMAYASAIDCLFTNNRTRADVSEYSGGGGAYESTLTNCIVVDNYAWWDGGAMLGGSAVGCLLADNFASQSGGGGYDIVAVDCVITNNRTDLYGGGGGLALSIAYGCSIVGNFSDSGVGGMWEGSAFDCLISGNGANDDAGGAGGVLAVNCRIQDNHGGISGGGVGLTAINCLVSGNTGGLFDGSGGLDNSFAYNCTIIDNYTESHDGVAMNGTAYNCIITGNINDENSPANFSGDMYNSCCPDAIHGVSGNITNIPLFVDAFSGNYRLQSNSPCINWGNNNYMTNAVDLDDNPRVVEDYVDMGCLEYQGILGLSDSDNDGLPDDWERDYFGGNVDPDRDDDNDHQSNRNEQIANTDPMDDASFFAITNSSVSMPFTIEWWPCATGRYYGVWWSTNLLDGFQPLAVDIEYPQHSYTDLLHTAWSQLFYKTEVELKPEVPPVPVGTVLIPAGTKAVNDGIYSNYTLVVEQPFHMDACEVSGAMWSNVYQWAIGQGYDFSTNGTWAAADHPVVWINWYDCVKWCNARSQMEGRTPCYHVSGSLFQTGQVENVETDYEANGFRLPTQEEWEYAARGGFGGYLYPWGNTITTNDANYAQEGTTLCGSYPANSFGLFDIVGNVWEWCDNITTTHAPGIDEQRGRASGGFGDENATYLKCGIHIDLPSQGFTDNAWRSLGFRTICH